MIFRSRSIIRIVGDLQNRYLMRWPPCLNQHLYSQLPKPLLLSDNIGRNQACGSIVDLPSSHPTGGRCDVPICSAIPIQHTLTLIYSIVHPLQMYGLLSLSYIVFVCDGSIEIKLKFQLLFVIRIAGPI